MKLLKSVVIALALALSSVEASTRCLGAPSTSYGSGQLDCAAPVCIVAGGGLTPSPDPTKYFVCAGPSIQYEMSCAPGTCFSFEYQVCVHPRDWTDGCKRSETPTESSSTSTSTTPIEPETSSTSTTTDSSSTSTSTAASTETTPSSTTPEVSSSSSLEPESSSSPIIDSTPTTESSSTSTTTILPETTSIEPTDSTTSSPILFDGRYLQVCPGSNPDTVTYGEETCLPFDCNRPLFLSNWKQPDVDPSYYHECFQETVRRKRKCETGTCFHYLRQVCVPPAEWENFCFGL